MKTKQLKKTVAIVCGGDSSEHDVSLRSAQGLYSFFDKEIKGEAKPTKQQIKAFHDEIVQGYTEIFSGDKDVVGHMKELWFYLITLFPEKRDCLKKIQKCHDMVEYRLIVQQILS